MLIRFVLSNFLSFDEEREFNMIASSSLKTHKHHVYKVGKVDVLKAAAIYGANGAGKSNFIKAIEFLIEAITDGGISKSVNTLKFKLNKINETRPVSFEIEFTILKKIYSYGVSFNSNVVVEEWLYESGINIEDKLIFERSIDNNTGNTVINVAEKFKKTNKQKLLIELMEERFLKPGELLLSKSKELEIEEVTTVKNYLLHNIVLIYPGSKYLGLVPALTTSKRFNAFANDLLQSFDTGVSELGIEIIDFEKYFGNDEDKLKKELLEIINNGESVSLKTEAGGVIVTKEKGKNIVKKVVAEHINNSGKKVSFDLDEESDGTQRLLDFIPAFDGVLQGEVAFIIDEIDQSLHPALLKALVEKLMKDETTKGQLIFTTHESNLLDLDIFRQDEIWFAEKEKKSSSTQLYSLSDFKPRYDLDIRKGYLKGRFGAIPFLANLEELNWQNHA